MITWKDMEYMSTPMKIDTLDNSWMIKNTDMEYTDSLMEEHITVSGKIINEKAKDISGGQMEMNIAESSIMVLNKERGYLKRMDKYSESNIY